MPEIPYNLVVTGHENISWFQIPVYDVLGVDVLQALRDLLRITLHEVKLEFSLLVALEELALLAELQQQVKI